MAERIRKEIQDKLEKFKQNNVVKLDEELATWAAEDFRSLNGQIEYLLTLYVRQRKIQAIYPGSISREEGTGTVNPIGLR